ncbi:MAG: hypothetical protein KKC68_09440 [Candidatus Thermoplasmatota archaeon]|nr:hypothetical protein [Candidatus Thermoplasmatota archaeon]
MDIPTSAAVLTDVLQKNPLCDACLGRVYRSCFQGMNNDQIGKEIRRNITIKKEIPSDACWVCEGLTGEIDHFVTLIEQKLKGYEFASFLIGTQIADDVIARQRQIVASLDI